MLLKTTVQLPRGPLPVEIPLDAGAKIALLGENGIGKSSLFHHLKLHRGQLFSQEKVAFVDQGALSALSHLQVRDLLTWLASNEHIDSFREHELWSVGEIERLWEQKISNLSGGEGQLVKMLCGLCSGAKILFVDEPLQYLDQEKREAVLTLMGKYCGTIVLIEHDLQTVKEFAEKIYRICYQEASGAYQLSEGEKL